MSFGSCYDAVLHEEVRHVSIYTMKALGNGRRQMQFILTESLHVTGTSHQDFRSPELHRSFPVCF